MKMVLEFTDEDAFEKDKLKRAVTADDAYSCLWNIDDYFRQLLKNKGGELDENQYKLVSKIEEKIREIYEDNKIDLDLWS